MIHLVFIATDFQIPDDSGPAVAHERLPQLERLLSRARHRKLAGGWRDWLAASVAPADFARLSPAALVRAARRGVRSLPSESTGCWLATPVHYFAGLDSLHLHPAGLLQLRPETQQQLTRDFARVFDDSPWRLESLDGRELLLSGPVLDADGADPVAFLGGDPSAGLPRGEGAGMLRRLGSEIEMWLHEHPLNREREARGELAVTALWLWGARLPLPADGMRLERPRIYGRDVYSDALCQLLQLPTGDLSQGLHAIESVPIGIASDTVMLMENVLRLEPPVMSAALQAVQRRQLQLHLIAGAKLFSVSSWRLMQWWRNPRPWWEVVT